MQTGQVDQPLVINNKSCKRYFIVEGSKVYFTADFDSGNIEKMQQIAPYIYKLHPGFDKTRFSTDKTFFYFKVSGFKMCTVRFLVTRQYLLEKFIKKRILKIITDLFSDLLISNFANSKTEMQKSTQIFIQKQRNSNDDPELSFQYAFQEDASWVEFAFSYPFSYEDNQNMIKRLAQKYQAHDEIYFHDQILGHTREQRRLHLITITEKMNCNKKEQQEYPKIEGMFPQIAARPYKIDRPKVIISGRVHPGQAPASYCIQGLLNFLLNQKDYRAYLLRKNFHFIIIPMLNPDGVHDGMFRADPLGNNLNRFYKDCSRKKHPTIFYFRKYLETLSDVLFYFDFHAHPSKKGFFIYGNAFDQFIHQVQAETFGKMIQSNCPYFECPENIFSQKQMGAKQKNDSHTKQGCGRVFVHRLFGNIIHSYTVQCGYFWPNKLNPYPKIKNQNIFSGDYIYDQSYEMNFSMKQYTQDSYRLMGKSILITILDIFHINPYSRVTLGQFKAISSIRKANAMRIYHQAQRFRMIDSNCYKKAKDIKEKAEKYYKERFGKWGLTISDNYGMKVKKRTLTLDPRLYMLKGMRNNKRLQKNPQIECNTQVNLLEQQRQASIQNSIEIEQQLQSIKQDQLQKQIKGYLEYQSNKQIARQKIQSSEKMYQENQQQSNNNSLRQSSILCFNRESEKHKQQNFQQQQSKLVKNENCFSYSSIKSIIKNAKITVRLNEKPNLSLSARTKDKNEDKIRSQTINKDYEVFKTNLQFVNDLERSKAERLENGLFQQKKDSKSQTKLGSNFKTARISTFLQKQRSRDIKKSPSINQRKSEQKRNLPVLYKHYYESSVSGKDIMKTLQSRDLRKLPGIY